MSRNVFSGSYSVGVPPLPIPNRAVKPARADGTAYKRESRSLPLFYRVSVLYDREVVRDTAFLCVRGTTGACRVQQGIAECDRGLWRGAGERAVGSGVWQCGRLCLAGRREGKVEGRLLNQ